MQSEGGLILSLPRGELPPIVSLAARGVPQHFIRRRKPLKACGGGGGHGRVAGGGVAVGVQLQRRLFEGGFHGVIIDSLCVCVWGGGCVIG